jgi:hypothetical protein
LEAEMNVVTLKYKCPVWVEVDLDSRTVMRVTVDDEAAVARRTAGALEAEALVIAEDEDWPAWTVGA